MIPIHILFEQKSKPQLSDLITIPLTKHICNRIGKQFKFNGCKFVGRGHREFFLLTHSDDHDDWIGVVAWDTLTKGLFELEINKKYQGMGYGLQLLKSIPNAEYVFSYNKKSDQFYMHHGWIKTDSYWGNIDNTQKYYLLLNPKWNKSVWSIKPSKYGKGIFSNIYLSEAENGEGIFLGLAFTKTKNTGNPDQDYARTELGAYVNHSNKPNIELVQQGKKFLYMVKNEIPKDTELTIDYNTFPWEGKRDFAK